MQTFEIDIIRPLHVKTILDVILVNCGFFGEETSAENKNLLTDEMLKESQTGEADSKAGKNSKKPTSRGRKLSSWL